MNTTKSTNGARLLLGSALAAVLAGCTTYVEGPPRTVYVSPPPPAPVVVAPPEGSVVIQAETDFYEPLNSYGSWVVVGSYGRCWRPARVEVDWRPYCHGNWRRTDAGWYWVSEEPWGWATYHYGRWDWTVELGWFWIPHTQWAPAWVSWRQGAGYVGWAPLPPSARIGTQGKLEFHERAMAPHAFVFVSEQRLLEPVRPTTVIVNNTTVINQTVNITKIQVVNKTVIAEGPRPEIIERRSGHKLEAVPVRELRHQEETQALASRRNGPAGAEKTSPPPLRNEAAPVKTVPTREPQPASAGNQRRNATESNPVPQPGQSPGRIPGRNEPQRDANGVRNPRTPEAAPVAKPEAAPANPIPGRPSRPAETPSETLNRPQPPGNKNEAGRNTADQAPGTPGRPVTSRPPANERQRALDRPLPHSGVHTNAAPGSGQPTATRQVDKRKTPEKKPAAVKPGDARKKKTDKKPDESQDPAARQTNAPPRQPQ